MKDQLIQKLMAEISDKYVAEYRATLDRKAAEQAAAAANAADNSDAAAGGSAAVRSSAKRGAYRGSSRVPVIWRSIAAGVVILVFLAGGLLLGKYLHKNNSPEPAATAEITQMPIETPTQAVNETADVTATPAATPAGATATPSVTAAPDATSVLTPEITATPAATPVPTGMPDVSGTAPDGTPIVPTASVVTPTAMPDATSAATPEAPTATSADTSTATPAATPAVTPTATPTGSVYATAKLEAWTIAASGVAEEPSFSDVDETSRIFFVTSLDRDVGICGYAYRSDSPLKEVYYRIGSDPTEHVCRGPLYARNDIATAAGFGTENAQSSGFGGNAESEYMLLSDLPASNRITTLHFMARFENGAETELGSVLYICCDVIADNGQMYYECIWQDSGEKVKSIKAPGRTLYIFSGLDYDNIYSTVIKSDISSNREYDFLAFYDGEPRAFNVGNIDLSLFSYCELDYVTHADFDPYDTATMSESAFLALGTTDALPGCGADGPHREGLLATAACASYDADNVRTATISLADVDYDGNVWLSAYLRPGMPVFVTEIRFYF
ncbi:MAG: hypothetical protein J5584_07255 [Clostridia bacterium]|nr:hypothetical protein [Clostridia bacterium]